MVSSAIWVKHEQVRFSKSIKIARVRRMRRVLFEVFEKLTSVCFIQISRETILLRIKRQFFSMSRICNEKCSKPKIFLAFLSKLLCFSFIL